MNSLSCRRNIADGWVLILDIGIASDVRFCAFQNWRTYMPWVQTGEFTYRHITMGVSQRLSVPINMLPPEYVHLSLTMNVPYSASVENFSFYPFSNSERNSFMNMESHCWLPPDHIQEKFGNGLSICWTGSRMQTIPDATTWPTEELNTVKIGR